MRRMIVRTAARVGTGLCVLALVFGCARIPGLREESSSTYIRVPFVRVLLDDGHEHVTLDGKGSFAIECLFEGRQSVFYSSRPIRVANNRGRIDVEMENGALIEEQLDEVNVIPRGSGNRLKVNGKEYRGLIKVLATGQTLQVVNVVYMEDYLRGVVPPEIGKRSEDEIEAAKAQAVAARTYAMAHLRQYANEAYDMKSNIMDQIYEGVPVENKLINRAIDATAGHVIMFHDELIQAYYHSTCGSSTDNIASVWNREEIPYLKPVADNDACSWSKYYSWTEQFTEPQLRGRIEQYLSSDRGREIRIGQITDIRVAEQTAGGRVARLLVRTDQDVHEFLKDRIRWVIGRTSNPDLILPSAGFVVDIDRETNGNIKKVVFRGQGYGHGVGMCQCGAIGLARRGWTFDSILGHYYTGIDVRKLY